MHSLGIEPRTSWDFFSILVVLSLLTNLVTLFSLKPILPALTQPNNFS